MNKDARKQMLEKELELGLTEERRVYCEGEEAQLFSELDKDGKDLPDGVKIAREWNIEEQKWDVKFYRTQYTKTTTEEQTQYVLLKALDCLENAYAMRQDIHKMKNILTFWLVLTIIGLSVGVIAALVALF